MAGQQHRETQMERILNKDKAPANAVRAPFDRGVRRRQRDRAATHFADHAFLKDRMDEEILARLDALGRPFQGALDLGCHDGRLGRALNVSDCVFADSGFRFAAQAGGVMCDEDHLPFADGSFDLVVSSGDLHHVNDLPGALIAIRRLLRPGGYFLASFVGEDSLHALRHIFADIESRLRGKVALRFSPMVDLASASALLQRAGFAMPVADIDTVMVGYRDVFSLFSDIRGMGDGNILRYRHFLGRDLLQAVAAAFAACADDKGRVRVPIRLLHLAGCAPPDSSVAPR